MSQLHSSSAASPFSIERKSRFTRTKTVATVGPASGSLSVLKELLAAGVDVFRINMAHGHREDHQRAVDTIREACREARRPAGILVDLAGPKIRLGQLHTDPLELSPGDEVIFVSGNSPAASHELTCSYESLMEEVSVGDDIMLSDGLIRLKVLDKGHQRVRCQVVDGGTLRSRQGVNLPGVRMGVAALLPQDIDNATWAADNQIEFVSLSFVRRASEVEDLKARLRQRGSAAMIIAKIEKREALDHLDAIVAAADAVMVARGDLGV